MILRFLPFSAYKLTDRILPTDNGICTILNMNNTSPIFSQHGKDNFLFKATDAFSPKSPQGTHKHGFDRFDLMDSNATNSSQPVKGTGPNRALIMDIQGTTHAQVMDVANEFKRFTVSL